MQVGIGGGTGKHLARRKVAVEWGWLFKRHSCHAGHVTMHPGGREDPLMLTEPGHTGH